MDAVDDRTPDALPVLDNARLEILAGDDREFLAELLGAFEAECVRHAAEFEAWAADRDAALKAAHTLKGASRNMGADRLAAAAEAFEAAVKDGAADAATRLAALQGEALAAAAAARLRRQSP